MQRGRAYSRGTNPWKITPSPLKAKRHGFNHDAFALKNPVGEPYSGTDPKRLWLLRSRPDQVHRRTMRRGPPGEILAELRFACLLESHLAGPEGRYVGPLPGPPPEGEGVRALLRLPGRLASLCCSLLWAGLRLSGYGRRCACPGGSLRFAALCIGRVCVRVGWASLRLPRGARWALPLFALGGPVWCGRCLFWRLASLVCLFLGRS